MRHFLHSLNDKLEKNLKTEEEQLGLVKAEKKKTIKKSELQKLGKGGKLEPRVVNAFRSLSVFGLTEHHLGKEAVEALGVSCFSFLLFPIECYFILSMNVRRNRCD